MTSINTSNTDATPYTDEQGEIDAQAAELEAQEAESEEEVEASADEASSGEEATSAGLATAEASTQSPIWETASTSSGERASSRKQSQADLGMNGSNFNGNRVLNTTDSGGSSSTEIDSDVSSAVSKASSVQPANPDLDLGNTFEIPERDAWRSA